MAAIRSTRMLTIRPYEVDDENALAGLFAEVQAHYGVPCPPLAEILEELKRSAPGVEILVAQAASIIGFASFATIFPGPGVKAGLFLKEIFVSKAHRNRGVGEALLRSVAAVALARGHTRVDWTADKDNPGALRLYQRLGAEPQSQKVFFRLSGQALATLAGKSNG